MSIPSKVILIKHITLVEGSRDGAVVRALASHKCGRGSIPGLGVICELGLLLVLVPAPRIFLRVLRFSSLHETEHFQILFDRERTDTFRNELLELFGAL